MPFLTIYDEFSMIFSNPVLQDVKTVLIMYLFVLTSRLFDRVDRQRLRLRTEMQGTMIGRIAQFSLPRALQARVLYPRLY